MALIVETGAGVPNAEAYSAMVWLDTYHDSRGRLAWASAAEATKEAAVRRGTRAIDLLFGGRWPGQRTYGRDQSLAWPRINAITTEGHLLLGTDIPIELQEAAAEAIWLEFNTPGLLIPTGADRQKDSVTVGPISVTYRSTFTARVEQYIPFLEKYLWNLLLDVGAGMGMQWLLRA